MKFHQLRDFLAIVEKQNISSAAKFLGIAQPSLSRSVRELEKDLGVPLFERHARGVALTEMGRIFYRRARMMSRELEKAREEIGELRGQVRGTLSIGLSSVSHYTLLNAALTPFQKRYPAVQLTLIEGAYPLFETGLKEGNIDLYVGPAPDNLPQELKAEQLFHPSRAVLARRGHPLANATSLAELLQADWITTSLTDRAEAEFGEIFESHGLPPPRLSIRVSSALTVVTALTSSDALTISSRTFSESPLASDALMVIEVKEALTSPHISLVYRAGAPPTPAADYFADMIRRAAVPMKKQYPTSSAN